MVRQGTETTSPGLLLSFILYLPLSLSGVNSRRKKLFRRDESRLCFYTKALLIGVTSQKPPSGRNVNSCDRGLSVMDKAIGFCSVQVLPIVAIINTLTRNKMAF